jgi:hypothetical protein
MISMLWNQFWSLGVSDKINVAGIVAAAFGSLVTAYFSDMGNISLSDMYKGIYGKYKMFNFSREGNDHLIEWNVTIKRRILKLQKFKAQYRGKEASV